MEESKITKTTIRTGLAGQSNITEQSTINGNGISNMVTDNKYVQDFFNRSSLGNQSIFNNLVNVFSKKFTAMAATYKLNHDVIFNLQINKLYTTALTSYPPIYYDQYSIEMSAVYNKVPFTRKQSITKNADFNGEKLFADLVLTEIKSMKESMIDSMQKIEFTSYLEEGLKNLF